MAAHRSISATQRGSFEITLGLLSSIVAACLAVGGCRLPAPELSGPGYHTVSNVENCMPLSRRPNGGERHLETDHQLASILLAQVEATLPEGPECWYLSETGRIRLWAGYFCAGPLEVLFEPKNGSWAKISENRMITTCDPPR